jgi:hypothetical protein
MSDTAKQICGNCEEPTERLVVPAYMSIPELDLSDACEGDYIEWEEVGDKYKSWLTLKVYVIDGQPYVRMYDSPDEPVCVRCYNCAIWPSLYQYLQGKPEQIKLDGWVDPVWVE